MILEAVKPLGWFGVTMGQWANDIEEALNKAVADMGPSYIQGELGRSNNTPPLYNLANNLSMPMSSALQQNPFQLTLGPPQTAPQNQNLAPPAAGSVNSLTNSSPQDSLLGFPSRSNSNSSPKTDATPNFASSDNSQYDSVQRERMVQDLVEQVLADISSGGGANYPLG
ncbi:hypothetical protein BT69DRAFT_1277969 [Atractiella rhizophila]|nr:hypothetical protein BT69DRAFT_1277969 [Atractiella rhizophila]